MNHKVFNMLLLILFLVFITIYFSSRSNLIDYQAKNRKELTNDEIKEFESDLKNNQTIDIKKYNKNPNYENSLSRASLSLSKGISNSINGILNFMFKKLQNN